MSHEVFTASIQAAINSLSQGDRQGYARNVGKAAGFVLALDLPGIESSVMFDLVSDAFESEDTAVLEEIRKSVARLADDSRVDDSQDSPDESGASRRYPSWDEYGSALNEAIEARNTGDSVRYSLMIGLVSGMMFKDPGPRYEDGTTLSKIIKGVRNRLAKAATRSTAPHHVRCADDSADILSFRRSHRGSDEHDAARPKLRSAHRARRGRIGQSTYIHDAQPGIATATRRT